MAVPRLYRELIDPAPGELEPAIAHVWVVLFPGFGKDERRRDIAFCEQMNSVVFWPPSFAYEATWNCDIGAPMSNGNAEVWGGRRGAAQAIGDGSKLGKKRKSCQLNMTENGGCSCQIVGIQEMPMLRGRENAHFFDLKRRLSIYLCLVDGQDNIF